MKKEKKRNELEELFGEGQKLNDNSEQYKISTSTGEYAAGEISLQNAQKEKEKKEEKPKDFKPSSSNLKSPFSQSFYSDDVNNKASVAQEKKKKKQFRKVFWMVAALCLSLSGAIIGLISFIITK